MTSGLIPQCVAEGSRLKRWGSRGPGVHAVSRVLCCKSADSHEAEASQRFWRCVVFVAVLTFDYESLKKCRQTRG